MTADVIYCLLISFSILQNKKKATFTRSGKLAEHISAQLRLELYAPIPLSGKLFPPSHKATAGQAAVTLQVASANYPLQLFANDIESHFLNDF